MISRTNFPVTSAVSGDYIPYFDDADSNLVCEQESNCDYAKGVEKNMFSSCLLSLDKKKEEKNDKEFYIKCILSNINHSLKEDLGSSDPELQSVIKDFLNSLSINELLSFIPDAQYRISAQNQNPLSRDNRKRYDRLMQIGTPEAVRFAREIDRTNPNMSNAQFDAELSRRGIKYDYYHK